MKYENIEKAQELKSLIEKCREQKRQLESADRIDIHTKLGMLTVDLDGSDEMEPFGKDFIESIIRKLQNEMGTCFKQIEAL